MGGAMRHKGVYEVKEYNKHKEKCA